MTSEYSDDDTGGGPGAAEPQFFEAFPSPVVQFALGDGSYQVQAVNSAFESFFGVNEEGVTGDSLAEYLQALTVERISDASGVGPPTSLDSMKEGERQDSPVASGSDILTHLKSDANTTVTVSREVNGERRYFQLRSFPLCDVAEDAYLVYIDVTALERRARRWEDATNRLEQFASVATHDIRNPLDVADIRLEAARETGEEVHFEKVALSLDRIHEIVDDVLSAGRTSVELDDSVALGECAEAAWSTVDTADATLSVLSDLPTIRADRSRLLQLFENLFRNAVEHGGQKVTVTVGRLAEGFFVADDGPGIPKDEHDRVFEVGYSTTEENTGLGLAIVTQIAEAHGWQARLCDADSGGARFEFTGVTEADTNEAT